MAGAGFNAAGAAGMGIAGGPAGGAAQAAGAAGNGMGAGSPQRGTVLAALGKEMEKSKANPDQHKKEFTWQKDYGQVRVADFKLDVLSPHLGYGHSSSTKRVTNHQGRSLHRQIS
jgi:hypothetical protein